MARRKVQEMGVRTQAERFLTAIIIRFVNSHLVSQAKLTPEKGLAHCVQILAMRPLLTIERFLVCRPRLMSRKTQPVANSDPNEPYRCQDSPTVPLQSVKCRSSDVRSKTAPLELNPCGTCRA